MFSGVRTGNLLRALRLSALSGDADAAHVLKMRLPVPKLPRMPQPNGKPVKAIRRGKR